MMDNLINTYEDEWANVVNGLSILNVFFFYVFKNYPLQTLRNATNSNNLLTHQSDDHKPKLLRNVANRDPLIGLMLPLR